MASLRVRQKAGRRRDILAAAGELFRRDGFDRTSIEGIAERAAVAPGTVYNYFRSKGDLLLALVALDGEEIRADGKRLIARPPADPVAAVNRLLEGYVDHALVYLDKRLWRNIMATALTQAATPFGQGYAELDGKLAGQVADLLTALQERGRLPATLRCDDAGQILFAVCNTHFMTFVAQDDMPLAVMKEAMFRHIRMVFEGLIAPSGTAKPGQSRSQPAERREPSAT